MIAHPEAKELFDGLPRQLEISIEAKDIEEGKHRDCEECPTALAVCREVGKLGRIGTPTIAVGGLTTWIGFDDVVPAYRVSVSYMVPGDLQKWIAAYDQHQWVGPMAASLKKGYYSLMDIREAA